jgi:hypothetical protein
MSCLPSLGSQYQRSVSQHAQRLQRSKTPDEEFSPTR